MGACYIIRKQDTSPSAVSAEHDFRDEEEVDDQGKNQEHLVSVGKSNKGDEVIRATLVTRLAQAQPPHLAMNHGATAKVNSSAIVPSTAPGGLGSLAPSQTGIQTNLSEPGLETQLGGMRLLPSDLATTTTTTTTTAKSTTSSRSVAPSQGATAHDERPELYKSPQAMVGLWKHISVKDESVERGAILAKTLTAEIYKGRLLGVVCAIKMFRTTATAKQLQEAMREIQIGASLDHPCTLRVLGWVRRPLQTITELCCGDLEAFYKDKIDGLPYSEAEALRFFKVGWLACGRGLHSFMKSEISRAHAHSHANAHAHVSPGKRQRTPLPSPSRHHSPRYQTREHLDQCHDEHGKDRRLRHLARGRHELDDDAQGNVSLPGSRDLEGGALRRRRRRVLVCADDVRAVRSRELDRGGGGRGGGGGGYLSR